MNEIHLKEFINVAKEHNLKVLDLISQYTAKAIDNSENPSNPLFSDYEVAYLSVLDSYRCKK